MDLDKKIFQDNKNCKSIYMYNINHWDFEKSKVADKLEECRGKVQGGDEEYKNDDRDVINWKHTKHEIEERKNQIYIRKYLGFKDTLLTDKSASHSAKIKEIISNWRRS